MSKIITQETFDDTVKENIEVFSMTIQEAKLETITQFEAQGINLDNIIKNLDLNEETGIPILIESIESLRERRNIISSLKMIQIECNKSIPHRVFAAKLGAPDLVFEVLEKETNNEVINECLLCEIALTNKHPDIFNVKWLPVVKRLLKSSSTDIVCNSLRWFQKACILHERNRQAIMSEEFVEDIKPLIKRDENEIIIETCGILRYLILDDDVRVEFGKAHEHARTISTEVLEDLTVLISKFKDDEQLLQDLLVTIAALIVRNEFCVLVEKAGGLQFAIEAMNNYPNALKLNREALKLLKSLAGNDQVKEQIIQQGAAPLIDASLSRFKSNEKFAQAALGCISTLTLRSHKNSQILFETGITDTILETLKIHEKSKMVQRNGAWAIRNMVSRAREQCDHFIAMGAGDILETAMKNHPSVSQDIKSALRDLGCKVHLNEEWTGVAKIKIAD